VALSLSCRDETVAPVVPRVIEVSVAPKTASINVGQMVIMTALVRVEGAADQTVTWTSTNPSVASVSEDGVVLGHAAGSVAIIVKSVFDPEMQDIATVAVSVFSMTPPSVAIQSVNRSGTIIPVDPMAVSGGVDVLINVFPGDQFVTRIDCLVGTTVVASQIILPSPTALGKAPFVGSGDSAPFSVTLGFNSAQFDPSTAVALFPNIEHMVSVRVVTTIGGTADASVQLLFANQNTFVASVSANGGLAADGAGRVWVSGNLMITARPVIYSAGAVSLVAALVGFPGLQTKASGPDGKVTWSKDVVVAAGGVGGFSNNGSVLPLAPTIIGSTLSNGAGPSGAFANSGSIAIRLDNRAPTAGVLTLTTQSASASCCSGGWVGSGYLFENGHSPPPADGEGVDGSGIGPGGMTYHVGAAALSTAQIAALPAVLGVETLAESNFADAYSVVARVADRVGNFSITRLGPNAANPITTFGVDKVSPSLAFNEVLSVKDGAINPGTKPFVTIPFETRSGYAAEPVVHRIIGNFSTANCFLGGNGCTMVQGGFLLQPDLADGSYYTYEAILRDQAGNSSSLISRTILFDAQAPSTSAMPLPSPLVGGAATQFPITVMDDVELHSAQHRLDFPSFLGPQESIPFSAVQSISNFGAPIVSSSNVAVTIPFVRSIELTTVAGVPLGVLQAASGTRYQVADQAGNEAQFATPFAGGTVPPGTGAGLLLPPLQTFRVTAPAAPTLLCTSQQCGATPQAVAISAVATGPANTFNNPFPRGVFFYWIDGGGRTQLIGVSTAPALNDEGIRQWTWTIPFTAPGAPAQFNVQTFAIGVDGEGDGLRSRTNTNITIISP
jgi:hypothetical protein